MSIISIEKYEEIIPKHTSDRNLYFRHVAHLHPVSMQWLWYNPICLSNRFFWGPITYRYDHKCPFYQLQSMKKSFQNKFNSNHKYYLDQIIAHWSLIDRVIGSENERDLSNPASRTINVHYMNCKVLPCIF